MVFLLPPQGGQLVVTDCLVRRIHHTVVQRRGGGLGRGAGRGHGGGHGPTIGSGHVTIDGAVLGTLQLLLLVLLHLGDVADEAGAGACLRGHGAAGRRLGVDPHELLAGGVPSLDPFENLSSFLRVLRRDRLLVGDHQL